MKIHFVEFVATAAAQKMPKIKARKGESEENRETKKKTRVKINLTFSYRYWRVDPRSVAHFAITVATTHVWHSFGANFWRNFRSHSMSMVEVYRWLRCVVWVLAAGYPIHHHTNDIQKGTGKIDVSPCADGVCPWHVRELSRICFFFFLLSFLLLLFFPFLHSIGCESTDLVDVMRNWQCCRCSSEGRFICFVW